MAHPAPDGRHELRYWDDVIVDDGATPEMGAIVVRVDDGRSDRVVRVLVRQPQDQPGAGDGPPFRAVRVHLDRLAVPVGHDVADRDHAVAFERALDGADRGVEPVLQPLQRTLADEIEDVLRPGARVQLPSRCSVRVLPAGRVAP